MQKHGIADADRELQVLDQYIEETWAARGLYPGLGSIVSVLADLAESEPQQENQAGPTIEAAWPWA